MATPGRDDLPRNEPAHGEIVIEPASEARRVAPYVGGVGGTAITIWSIVSEVWPMTLFGAGAVAASGLLGRKTIMGNLRWKEPKLVLPAAALPMSEPVPLIYRRSSRKPVDVSSSELQVTLTCEEQVQWEELKRDSEGEWVTSTVHKSETVYQEGIVGELVGTLDGFEGHARVVVPATAGAPSFSMDHNEVRWFVDVRAVGPRLPEDQHRFDIDVAPVLGPANSDRRRR